MRTSLAMYLCCLFLMTTAFVMDVTAGNHEISIRLFLMSALYAVLFVGFCILERK